MVIGIDCSRALSEGRTGTENYSYYLIREMLRLPASQKHDFVLYIRPKVKVPSWMRRKGVVVSRIQLKYLWTQLGLSTKTWVDKLDVLFVPAHTLPILRKPGFKTVVTIHGLEYKWLPEYQNFLQRWYLPLSTFYAARKADKLIAVSDFTRQQLVDELGVAEEKIKVIYEGVELTQNLKIRNQNHKPNTKNLEKIWKKCGLVEGKYVLFVGTLQPRKNLPELIKAFELLDEETRKEIKLVIAGRAGWLTKEIFLSAYQSKVSERIVFTGRIEEEELQSLLKGAIVYVQPSIQEGFGLPILEAMAAGVPVIASNGGALPEVVGEAGVVVRLGKGFQQRLAEEIEKLILNRKKREILMARGKKRVREFGWKKAAENTFLELIK